MKDFMNERNTQSIEDLLDKLLTIAVKFEKEPKAQKPEAHDHIEYVFRCIADLLLSVTDTHDEALEFGDRVAHRDEAEFGMRAAIIVEAFASFAKGTGGQAPGDWRS